MRKRLMEFYRLTKCPVPHSSMLFKRRKAFYIKISSFFLSLLITVQQIGEWFDSQASEYIDYIIHHVTGELMDTELNIQNTVSVPQIQFLIDTIIAYPGFWALQEEEHDQCRPSVQQRCDPSLAPWVKEVRISKIGEYCDVKTLCSQRAPILCHVWDPKRSTWSRRKRPKCSSSPKRGRRLQRGDPEEGVGEGGCSLVLVLSDSPSCRWKAQAVLGPLRHIRRILEEARNLWNLTLEEPWTLEYEHVHHRQGHKMANRLHGKIPTKGLRRCIARWIPPPLPLCIGTPPLERDFQSLLEGITLGRE